MALGLEPQRLTGPPEDRNKAPEPIPGGLILAPALGRFWRLFRLSMWRAFEHDAFATAKGAAYSSILTFSLFCWCSARSWLPFAEERFTSEKFPMLWEEFCLREVPPRSPISEGVRTARLASWSLPRCSPCGPPPASSFPGWMDSVAPTSSPKRGDFLQERLIAISLVLMAGLPLTFSTILVAFGSRIETRALFYIGHEFGPLLLLLWGLIRWIIAILTSIAVIQLIYHNAVPRTQPWHSVLPGAVLATAMWLLSTAFFGWYLQRYADYSIIYGSLGVGIALLVWMYLISLVVLIGAEFNAMLFPRGLTKVPRVTSENT